MRVISFLFLCALFCSAANADERFYQIIDASGRVQLIRDESRTASQAKPEKKEKKEQVQSSASTLSADTETADKVEPQSGISSESSSKQEGKASAPYAAYDGDEYIGSEAMDASHQANNKKRFYVLNDGVGQRVENMSGTSEHYVSPAKLEQEDITSLKNTYLQLPLDVVKGFANGCLSATQLQEAEAPPAKKLRDIVFDRSLANFVTTGHLVQAYRIDGAGPRTVSLRSYSKTDINPAFVTPFVAFADANGCIARVADGYFQRFYAETKSRHPALEADLVMHDEDVYLLLIMPVGMGQANFKPEYRVSTVGRVSVKWQP